MNNKTIAYAVTESSQPAMVQDLRVHDKNRLFYVEFDTVLQTLNTKNRNGRTYGPNTGKALFSDSLVELRREKSWFGEAGHPLTNDITRIVTISPSMVSHRIDSVEVRGDVIHGHISTLDNGRYGNMMTRMILQGMEPAFSLRALANIEKGPSGQIVRKQPRITTYDWVIHPSHREAYRDKSTDIKVINEEIKVEGNVFKSTATPLTESMIVDFIKEESGNLKILTESMDVESLMMSDDLRNIIITESTGSELENVKYKVVMEQHIKNELDDYLSSL